MKPEHIGLVFAAFALVMMFYVQLKAVEQRDAALALAQPKITTSAGVVTVRCPPRELNK